MLVIEDLINKMKLHFPKWMDIRRKVKSSTGGNVLTSVAIEVAEIKTAIEEYTKDFFITNYMEDPNKLISVIYKADVGILKDIKELQIITDNLEVVENEKLFYETQANAFYKDGKIYVKKNYSDGLKISIDKYIHTVDLSPHQVWNVFDEFAAFLSLRRFENESNEEILKRILKFSSGKADSTEDGLKHAIISNLVNIAPELKSEEIVIERPTPENLNKYYDKFETILDHLSRINRDSYKEKRWDIDTWNFDIKSIDFIPHMWDISLAAYQNGIGFEDDLKVEILNNNSITDVDINFYQKDLESLTSYISKNDISTSTELKLRKYVEDLKEDNVKFKITSSEAKKIDTSKIKIKTTEEKVGETKIILNDISDKYVFNIEEVDNSIFDSSFDYEIDFIPSSDMCNFYITNAESIKGDKIINLLSNDKQGFIGFGQKGIKSSYVKKYVETAYDFDRFENMVKTNDGFEISDLSKEGECSLNIDGCSRQKYLISYSAPTSKMLLADIGMSNCVYENNKIIPNNRFKDSYITINKNLNFLSMDIQNECLIEYTINDETPVREVHAKSINNFSIPKREMPFDLKLKVTMINPSDNSKIENIEYSKYKLEITTDYSISPLASTGVLPTQDINTLNIVSKSYTGKSIIINKIYIGKPLTKKDGYFGIKINEDTGYKISTKFNDCYINLKKINKSTKDIIEIIEDYKPYKGFKGIDETSSIALNLSEFDAISKVSSDVGKIETIKYSNDCTQYTLKLREGEIAHEITVIGTLNRITSENTLDIIMHKKGYSRISYDFYASKTTEDIIIKHKVSNKISYEKITRDDIANGMNISKVIIEAHNGIMTKFTQGSKMEKKLELDFVESNSYFDYVSFYPKDGKLYVAINEITTAFPLLKDIEMVNTFNNGYDESKDVHLYKVESLNDNYIVRFDTNESFSLCEDIALDAKTLSILRKENTIIRHNYIDYTYMLAHKLESSTDIPKEIILNTGETLSIDEIIILNDLNISFKNRLSDAANLGDYIKTESVTIGKKRFSKLKYSYIYDIEKIEINSNVLTKNDYTLMAKEGIIIWNNFDLDINSKVKITYSIEIASAFNLTLDEIYKKVNYNVQTYKKIDSIFLENLEVNQAIDLNLYDSYKEADKISIECNKAGFHVDVANNGLATIIKDRYDNAISVKAGYYYTDGIEYYKFANKSSENIEIINNVYFYNVIKKNKKLYLMQDTMNSIFNSKMELKTKGEIYNLDCSKKDIKGISNLNSITSCDTYNFWNVFGSNMSITKGMNDLGIEFKSMSGLQGYGYLNVSDLLEEEDIYTISLYLKGNGKAYLGKERELYIRDNKFNNESTIDIVSEFEKSTIEEDIYTANYDSSKGTYYLIIRGDVVIDDIIVTNKDKYEIGAHTKNISYLNLDIQENIYSEYRTRLLLTDRYGSKCDGLEIKEDESILNTALLNWGFTKKKDISSYEDFSRCYLENIDLVVYNNKCVAKTGELRGKITTNAIQLGNPKVLNNILFKINNVMFDDMRDFTVEVLTANSINDNFRLIGNYKDVIGSIDSSKVGNYIKLNIYINENKVINNIGIYIEYSSNSEQAPAAIPTSQGVYTSKILDSQFTERFLVKTLKVTEMNNSKDNYLFQVRATKDNNEKTVWTDWKEILIKDGISNENVLNRIIFDGYRYFQFRAILKGEGAKVKLEHMELEVI